MRVVFTASGSRGDVQPMLALALSAQAAGHDVLLCAPPNFAGWVRGHQVPFQAVGIDAEAMLKREAAAATSGAWAVLGAFRRALAEEFAAQFRDLPAALTGAELVIGGGVSLAAPTLCEERGVPFAYTIYAPTMLRSAHHAPILIPWQRLPRLVNRLLWRVTDVLYDRLFLPRLNQERARRGMTPVRDLYRHFTGTAVLVAADEVLAPLPPDIDVPWVRCGALAPPQRDALDPAIEAFLAAGPPPIYCGFGSMTDPRPQETAAQIVAAAARVGARLILSRGWANLGLGQPPEGVLLIDAAPHALLFPRVAAVLHHGGAGTTITAARAGVPQVVVPHLMDQHYFGARVHGLGVAARPLARTRLSAERLAAALQQALAPETVLRARTLAGELRPPLSFGELLPLLPRRAAHSKV